jgi:hypothetical protein
MKRYLIQIEGGTEPVITGPFESDKARLDKAKSLRENNDEDGFFKLDIPEKGRPRIESFLSNEIDPLFQE